MTTSTANRMKLDHILALVKPGLFGSEPTPPTKTTTTTTPAPTHADGTPLSVEDLMAALQSIIDSAGDKPLTEDQANRYEQLEVQLRSARRDVEIRSRQQAYVTPTNSLAAAVHVGTQRADDTLERSFNHYMRTGRENADMVELRAQATTPGSAGGFLVPTTTRNKLIERIKTFGGLANNVEEFTTTGGEEIVFPTIDDTMNVGVIAAENAAPTSGGADLVFGERTLGAFKYVAPGLGNAPLAVSVELLQDSAFDVEALVERKLGERIGRAQAAHWVGGLGTTQPNGISSGTPVDVNTFDAPTISYQELVNCVHQIDPAYRVNASWCFSDGTMALVERVVDNNGRPLLNPASDGVSTGPRNQTLLGYPVIIDNAWPTYADGTVTKWGVFGDLQAGYIIRRVRDLTMVVNPYSSANFGKVEYVLWARADGTVQDPNTFRVLVNEVS